MMGRGFFVAGTGTGVGKTMVTAALACGLRSRGWDAVPMKPVQTGATEVPGGWRAPDLAFCLKAAGLSPSPEERDLMQPCCYGPAASPHLAARLAGGRYPDISRLRRCAVRLLARHELVLAEGAGGVLAPLDEERTMLDLMKALSWPVILVAHSGLGTINHTLLSLAALRSRGLQVAGFILTETEPPSPRDAFIRADNPRAITSFGAARFLGTLRHLRTAAPAGLRRAFRRDLEAGLGTLFPRP